MRVSIDLLGAKEEQKARFSEPRLTETLTALRLAVGDPKAEIEVRWGPAARSVVHVVQSFEDLPTGLSV